MEMPSAFHVDITLLQDFEKTIVVGDVAATGDVTILNDPEEMIARVAPPRIEVVEIAEEELGDGEVGEEGEGVQGRRDSDAAGAAETTEE